MPYVTGFLNIVGPTDPGFGNNPGMGSGNRPGNELPGWDRPTDPGYGRPDWSSGRPDQGLPGSGNYPSGGFPISPGHPSQGLPGSGNYPSHGLPGGGGMPSNELPPIPGVYPPISPSNPIVPVPPDLSKPIEPGTVYPPLHEDAKGKYICLVAIPGVGWRYTVIDTSLTAGLPLPSNPAYPSGQPIPGGEHPSGQPVPPPGTAQPKK